MYMKKANLLLTALALLTAGLALAGSTADKSVLNGSAVTQAVSQAISKPSPLPGPTFPQPPVLSAEPLCPGSMPGTQEPCIIIVRPPTVASDYSDAIKTLTASLPMPKSDGAPKIGAKGIECQRVGIANCAQVCRACSGSTCSNWQCTGGYLPY